MVRNSIVFLVYIFSCLFVIRIESIELSNIVNENDNNSDSGISPNDSEVEVLIFDRKFYDKKKEIFYLIFLFL